jgi:glyoxalase family protein
MPNINGLHHITAIARDPAKNVGFYAAVLGLRLVKKTVNFDDPYTYHLYYGDDEGRPGTLITFFPWPNASHDGRRGSGQLTRFSFSVPAGSAKFWERRLDEHRIPAGIAVNRWGEEIVSGVDHDGFEFELIAQPGGDARSRSGPVDPEFAITGLRGITMCVSELEPSAEFLTRTLGFEHLGAREDVTRFASGKTFIDVVHEPKGPRGKIGAGIIHHVAWRTPDDASQVAVRNHLLNNNIEVTPVIDRKYFHSIYFNDPGGAIFEVATEPPGFLVDEAKSELGIKLQLPPQYEEYRGDIEKVLPPVTTPEWSERQGAIIL